MVKMLNDEIKNELIDKGVISPTDVIFIGQGEGHENYLATSGAQKVVIRVKRSDTPRVAGFKNERTQLLFLASQGITFAPQSIYYDEQKEVHVVTFIDGTDASFLELDSGLSTTFVQCISQIESLDYGEYVKFCTKNNIENTAIPTMEARIAYNYGHRLEVINNHRHLLPPDIDNFLDWCGNRFAEFIAMAKELKPIRHYNHGDVHHNNGTSNLRIRKDGTLAFIDWEAAGFAEDVYIEIGDVISSCPSIADNKDKLNQIIQSYMQSTSIFTNHDDTIARLRASIWYETVCTPLWMVERYVLSFNHDRKRAEEYLANAKNIQVRSDEYFYYKF